MKGVKEELNNVLAEGDPKLLKEIFSARNSTLTEVKMEIANTWDFRTNEKILSLVLELQLKATSFINRVHNELGIKLRISDDYRSIEEQNRLYAKGRTTPGKIVTKVRGGYSSHNYGKAIDVVEMTNGKTPVWTRPISEKIGRIGIELGLEWGGHWKSFYDPAHFQIK